MNHSDNISEVTYFVADSHTGESVIRWIRPGATSETSTIAQLLIPETFNSPRNNAPDDLVMLGNTLFFTAEHETGRELWLLEDMSNEPRLVKDINPGEFSSFPFGLHEFNGELYFGAFDPDHGRELWKTNGTSDGTVLVADIFPRD